MSLGVKCGRRVELTTLVVLVVLNVKVRMEAQPSILLLSLHDLLRETFTFDRTLPSGGRYQQNRHCKPTHTRPPSPLYLLYLSISCYRCSLPEHPASKWPNNSGKLHNRTIFSRFQSFAKSTITLSDLKL